MNPSGVLRQFVTSPGGALPGAAVNCAKGVDGTPLFTLHARLHDLRLTFASTALALGETLPVIAKLLGHSQIQTPARYARYARYAHFARQSVKTAADTVANSLAEDMGLPSGAPSAA